MAGGEHEAEEIIAKGIVERGVEIGHSPLLLGLQIAAKFLVLTLEAFVATEHINRTVLRGGHEPGAWIVGDARFRPLLEGSDESVLGEFLGEADIADDAGETRDDSGGLNPPDGIDGAVGEGRRHGYPSHHLRLGRASRPRGAEKVRAFS
jgi:hypothetical protein